jgi:triphosphoribosyl-dephospho-CoA synthase
MERIQAIERKYAGERQFASVYGFAGTAVCIAELAADALEQELNAYPKPGMVSRVDCGSHSDMNAATFLDSIKATKPFFGEMACAGFENASLPKLRQIGLRAEKTMFDATGGINTHKGAIFILGLLAASAGYTLKNNLPVKKLGATAAAKWGKELLNPAEFTGNTNGSAVYRQYGIKGARGEAASGFRHIYETGLPALQCALKRFLPPVAAVHCFFALLEKVPDTTLVHRGGISGIEFAREQAAAFNNSGGVFNKNWLETAKSIHLKFIERNLSAGGTADLLSATIFVNHLEEIWHA